MITSIQPKPFARPFFIILLLALCVKHGQAQEMNSGFDTAQYNPFFIQSSDGQFKFNLGLYTQFRYNLNSRSDTPDTVQTITKGYQFARTRIFLEANLTEKFYVHTRFNINPTGNIELIAGYLQWNMNKKMNMRIGKQFMALGREDWIYPQDLASIEFSATDFTYATWSSFGFQFNHQPSNKFQYWVSVGNGAYGGRLTFPTPEPYGATFTSRLEYNIIGDNFGLYGDMLGSKGNPFGIMIGAGGGYSISDEDFIDIGNAYQGSQINVDLSVVGNGFQFFTIVNKTFRSYKGDVTTREGSALYSTFGYWLDTHWFPYARFDYVDQGNYTGVSEDYASPGIGISYYPFTWTNRTRVSLEYNYLGATLNDTYVQPDGQLGWVESSYGSQQAIRFQLQFGF